LARITPPINVTAHVVVALTYGLAELVWRLYEAPMNAWIRTRLLRRRPAAALAAAP
jgi:peptidoglycan/LPS O-acetylase OafA/YrhL